MQLLCRRKKKKDKKLNQHPRKHLSFFILSTQLLFNTFPFSFQIRLFVMRVAQIFSQCFWLVFCWCRRLRSEQLYTLVCILSTLQKQTFKMWVSTSVPAHVKVLLLWLSASCFFLHSVLFSVQQPEPPIEHGPSKVTLEQCGPPYGSLFRGMELVVYIELDQPNFLEMSLYKIIWLLLNLDCL